MSAIHFHSFSRAYNEWLDYTADFRVEYEESQEYMSVLKVIFGFLNGKLDYPIQDPEHPFRRYADSSKTMEENYEILAGDVMATVQDAHLRGYVVAFFHTSGVNYGDMKELMDEYFVFADRSEDEDYSDSSTVADEDAHHIYEDEGEESEDEEEEEAQDEHNPNSV